MYTLFYSVHLGIKTITTINKHDFIIIVVQDNFEPRYICQSEALQSDICKSLSEAITSIYKQAFVTKTRLDGLSVIECDDLEIYKILLSDIYFCPYSFKIGDLNLVVSEIGKSNNADWNYARKEAIIRIYQHSQEIHVFHDTNSNTIWNKISILIQFTESILFRLEYEQMKSKISKEHTLSCTVDNWQNEHIMNKLFNYHLRKYINMSIE
ncbi:18517_t:CDS:2 [Gigaspora margarita]|uniref:18517_t:CDS:1 n=1 Tax=Gigaspora margarita TaxID=4874 RepID=A0ABN7URJ6_GIGMA|nr:18517_t:CDS:2 [Gigaspora margarita]